MIEITREDVDGGILLRLCGHAGYAAAGRDIVCAAVSALTCTLVQCLTEEQDAGRCACRVLRTTNYSEIECTVFEGCAEQVRAIVGVVWRGYALIAQQYPRYVRCKKSR